MTPSTYCGHMFMLVIYIDLSSRQGQFGYMTGFNYVRSSFLLRFII